MDWKGDHFLESVTGIFVKYNRLTVISWSHQHHRHTVQVCEDDSNEPITRWCFQLFLLSPLFGGKRSDPI